MFFNYSSISYYCSAVGTGDRLWNVSKWQQHGGVVGSAYAAHSRGFQSQPWSFWGRFFFFLAPTKSTHFRVIGDQTNGKCSCLCWDCSLSLVLISFDFFLFCQFITCCFVVHFICVAFFILFRLVLGWHFLESILYMKFFFFLNGRLKKKKNRSRVLCTWVNSNSTWIWNRDWWG